MIYQYVIDYRVWLSRQIIEAIRFAMTKCVEGNKFSGRFDKTPRRPQNDAAEAVS